MQAKRVNVIHNGCNSRYGVVSSRAFARRWKRETQETGWWWRWRWRFCEPRRTQTETRFVRWLAGQGKRTSPSEDRGEGWEWFVVVVLVDFARPEDFHQPVTWLEHASGRHHHRVPRGGEAVDDAGLEAAPPRHAHWPLWDWEDRAGRARVQAELPHKVLRNWRRQNCVNRDLNESFAGKINKKLHFKIT